MIVAITPSAAGIQKVEEFREAVDETTAVADFCGEYSPPLNVADYAGHDIGGAVPKAPIGGWCWDPAIPGLAEAFADAKSRRVGEIDARTRELIDVGFEWPPASGVFFSLSESAQRTMIGAYAARNDPSFVYPVIWNSKDDTATTSLATANDLRDFYFTGIAAIRTPLDSGTSLKDQIRAATTQAELDAVVDNR